MEVEAMRKGTHRAALDSLASKGDHHHRLWARCLLYGGGPLKAWPPVSFPCANSRGKCSWSRPGFGVGCEVLFIAGKCPSAALTAF